MASTKLMETKDGRRFFKITVSRGRGQSPYTTRWYWPDKLSKRAAERELAKQAAAFELACSRGEVLTRADIRRKEAEEQAEAAKTAYRQRRQAECFSVINRGRLWYDALTEEQLSELKTWYRAWLDGTNTQTIPEKPEWLT